MSKFSEFSFRPHKTQADEDKMHGLVDVHDRSTGEMIGMLNPLAGGGYVLRDRDGTRLSKSFGGSRFDDICYTSRETAAGVLRSRMKTIAEATARRDASVSAGCPNKWHNSGTYRETQPCPECPTRAGLKLALARIDSLIQAHRVIGGGEAGSLQEARDELAAMIYTPEPDANYVPSDDVLNAGK